MRKSIAALQFHPPLLNLFVQRSNFRVVIDSRRLVFPAATAAEGVAAHLLEGGDESLTNGEMGIFFVSLGASARVLRLVTYYAY